MQHTFPAGAVERIIIDQVAGNLTIRGWGRDDINMTVSGQIDAPHPEGDVLMIGRCTGNLELHVPHGVAIQIQDVRGNTIVGEIRQVEAQDIRGNLTLKEIEGDLVIGHVGGSLSVQEVATIRVRHRVGGNLTCKEVERVEIGTISGNADLHDGKEISLGSVGGHVTGSDLERVTVDSLGGHIDMRDVNDLSLGSVGGDVRCSDLERLGIGSIGGGLDAHDIATITFGSTGGNVTIRDTTSIQGGSVGGKCQIGGDGATKLELGSCGHHLDVKEAERVQVGHVGGHCTLHEISGEILIQQVDGDVNASEIEGFLQIKQIEGSLRAREIDAAIDIPMVSGNVQLDAEFPSEGKTHMRIGGNARIKLPEDANVTIHAMVGGTVKGRAVVSNTNSNVTLVYGQGTTQLELFVGGNLELDSEEAPENSTSYGWNWDEYGREMAMLGEAMGRKWRDFGVDIATQVTSATSSLGADIAGNVANMAEEQRRRAEDMRRMAEELTRKHTERIHVRSKNREWWIDNDHINRIVGEAQKAAAEGVQGAMEAVERALRNMHIPPTPPAYPTPPLPPKPPLPPQPPTPPFPGTPQPVKVETATSHENPTIQRTDSDSEPVMLETTSEEVKGETVKHQTQTEAAAEQAEHKQETPAINREQERVAILRMVAEGRLTPEEGDMLLEAL